MQPTSTKVIFHEDEVKTSFNKFKAKLRNLNSRLIRGQSSFAYGTKIVNASQADVVRVISEFNVEDNLECTIKNLFLNAVYSTEKTAPGSGFILAAMMADQLKILEISENPRATIDQVEKVINSNLSFPSLTSEISKKVVKLSGPASRIFFKKTAFDKFVIKKHTGKILRAEIHELFTTKIKLQESTTLILVDGILESVGEIDSMLNQLGADKNQCTIMARGYSGDVSTTLHENYIQSKLFAVPVVYRIGSSEDVSILGSELGINIFSPMTDNGIRTIKIADQKQFEKILFDDQTITIIDGSGTESQIEVMIPKAYDKVSGIIQDRVRFGKLLAESCMISGVATASIEGNRFMTSAICLMQAKKTYFSLLKNIKDLRCVVIA